MKHRFHTPCVHLLGAVKRSAVAGLLALGVPGIPGAFAETAAPDSTVLSGEGTSFPDMTIEGEDRIRIDFERPPLEINLDAKSAPGLDRDRTLEIVGRGAPDLRAPLMTLSARDRTPYLGHPWFSRFTSGPVARFRPAITGVERWTLSVADSRGETVARFSGDGKVPTEIPWDGRTLTGSEALPGLTYTYVLEAHDKAGNKRSFLGDGFSPRPYRRTSPGGVALYFSGDDPGLAATLGSSPLLMEAASWVNQVEKTDAPVSVEVRARSKDEATALAGRIEGTLKGLLTGPPTRLKVKAIPETDAPEAGVCLIRVGS